MASDGALTPEELLARIAGKMDVFALTDHDLPPALPVGIQPFARPLRLIAAAEVSGVHQGKELHLLVYFPKEMPADYQHFLRERASWRAWRYDHAAEQLGLKSRAPEAAHQGKQAITRHHLAKAMLLEGKIKNFQEAWRAMRAAVPVLELEFRRVIREAKAAGAVVSWAHPSLEDARSFLPELVGAGLDGLEVDRPLLPRISRNGLKALACRFRILATGGSDWHGWKEGGGPGLFTIAREYYEPLLSRLDR
jgi:predicted metal-dependent phosphoesterase TrpH